MKKAPQTIQDKQSTAYISIGITFFIIGIVFLLLDSLQIVGLAIITLGLVFMGQGQLHRFKTTRK